MPGQIGPAGEQGEPGKSAYEIAVESGYAGTVEEWLESLKGDPGPFLSSYMEALGESQEVAANARIVFDPDSIDDVGNNITLNDAGTVFTINRTGLYLIEWNVNLAADSTLPSVIGILENNQPASGSACSVGGSCASGTVIEVDAVPFTISLHNYSGNIRLENPAQYQDSAASIRIVRFADGASA